MGGVLDRRRSLAGPAPGRPSAPSASATRGRAPTLRWGAGCRWALPTPRCCAASCASAARTRRVGDEVQRRHRSRTRAVVRRRPSRSTTHGWRRSTRCSPAPRRRRRQPGARHAAVGDDPRSGRLPGRPGDHRVPRAPARGLRPARDRRAGARARRRRLAATARPAERRRCWLTRAAPPPARGSPRSARRGRAAAGRRDPRPSRGGCWIASATCSARAVRDHRVDQPVRAAVLEVALGEAELEQVVRVVRQARGRASRSRERPCGPFRGRARRRRRPRARPARRRRAARGRSACARASMKYGCVPSERSLLRSSIFGPSAAASRSSLGTGVSAASSPSKNSRIVFSGRL